MINGRVLVDGGLTNPVPIDPTVGVPSDLTVAVSLTGPRPATRDQVAPTQESAAPQRFEEWRSRLRRTVAGITGREDREQEVVPAAGAHQLGHRRAARRADDA